jgi:hypothetical protein
MLSAMYYSYKKGETLSDCQYEDGGWEGGIIKFRL